MNEKESDGPCEKCGYSNDAPYLPSYLAPGTILNDRYIVGKLLSYNGEGATYIGFDKVTGAKVTVREYMPDTLCSRKKGDPQIVVDANRLPLYKTYMSEFVELNKALLKARSMTHIQTVLDIFPQNNTAYVIFEFINGITLKAYLANCSGELSWDRVKELFPPILTTLSLVHSAGIIHRGISPQTMRNVPRIFRSRTVFLSRVAGNVDRCVRHICYFIQGADGLCAYRIYFKAGK